MKKWLRIALALAVALGLWMCAAALAEAGFAVRETEVVAVTVPDRPGGMAELTAKLDRAGVDIEYSYAYSLGHADKAVLVFKFDDNAKAEAALKAAD